MQIEGEMPSALRQAIVLAVGETGSPPENELMAQRVAREAIGDAVAALRSEGYYESVVEPDIGPAPFNKPALRITAGPRFKVKEVQLVWDGAKPEPAAVEGAEKALALRAGAPGRAQDVLAAESRAVAALRRFGYADAEVKPRQVVVDHADKSMAAHFVIAAGDKVHLGTIQGLTKGRTHARWLRRLQVWKVGEPFTPARIAKLEERLIETGAFQSATVSLADKSDATAGTRPVIVSLSERKARSIELSAAYTTSQGSGAEAKLTFYNRLGRADSLAITARGFDIQQKLDVELSLPHFLLPDQTFKIGSGFQGDRTNAYNDVDLGARVQLEHRFSKTTYFSFGAATDYTSTQEKTAANPQETPVGVKLHLLILTGTADFALDRSNDPLNPIRGWRVQAHIEPTEITGDRNLRYVKGWAAISGYLPVAPAGATVVAARLRVGEIFGGSIPEVPAERRFFAGGGSSVRGFGYQAVGPRLSDNTPEGGLSLVETSAEIRQRVTKAWGLVAFVDAGNVDLESVPRFRHLSVGAGVGVRYDLGFGPIRLDLGTPVNPRAGDGRIQVSISIGQSF